MHNEAENRKRKRRLPLYPGPPLCLHATDFTDLETSGHSLKQRGVGVKKLEKKEKCNKTTNDQKREREKNNNSLYRIYMITSLTQAEIPEAPGLHPQGGAAPAGALPSC